MKLQLGIFPGHLHQRSLLPPLRGPDLNADGRGQFILVDAFLAPGLPLA